MTITRAAGPTGAALAVGVEKPVPAQTAMSGQSFAQSGFSGMSGRHGMPSGISMASACAAVAAFSRATAALHMSAFDPKRTSGLGMHGSKS
jgi:hypothetical protein